MCMKSALSEKYLNQINPVTGLGQVCKVQVRDLRAAGVGGALREQDARVQERTHICKEAGWLNGTCSSH